MIDERRVALAKMTSPKAAEALAGAEGPSTFRDRRLHPTGRVGYGILAGHPLA